MELFVQANSQLNIKRLQAMGIDKIVVGMEQFSCRQAMSLSYPELQDSNKDTIELYVLVNALVEEKYLVDLDEHLLKLSQIGITGIVFQDFAVLQICREKGYLFDLVYAPDTLNTNHQTISYLQTFGVSKVFLAREISLAEKLQIQQKVSLPCIMQIHGVEYMAYSKRKLIQNYLEITKKTISSKNITIQAKDVEDACYIYEDRYGTHIVSKTQLVGLDVLDGMQEMAYGYIESMYIKEEELIEIVALYQQGLQAIKENTYVEIKDSLLQQLQSIQPNVKYYHSFLFDQTVYKIVDVRKREENESSK